MKLRYIFNVLCFSVMWKEFSATELKILVLSNVFVFLPQKDIYVLKLAFSCTLGIFNINLRPKLLFYANFILVQNRSNKAAFFVAF